MKKRMILMIVAVTVFLLAIGGIKYWQVQAAIAQYASYKPAPEAVTTATAREEPWAETMTAIGTVAAVHGVTVSADLPGIVERIDFESGTTVRAGQVLVELDTQQERAQLAAAEAQRDLARLNDRRTTGLFDKGVASQADHDRAGADLAQREAEVREIRATIERKTIRAPFSGTLGIRQVNLGQYLAAGAPVVPLQSLDPVFVDFSLPQQDVGRLRLGAAVHIATESPKGKPRSEASGTVTAVDSIVNDATRNVRVQATLPNPGGALRPGMFVDAQVLVGTTDAVVTIPASAIAYAPYGDSVYVVSEMKDPNGAAYKGVRQQFVKLGRSRGDQIAITSGIDPGDEVVTSGAFKLRNGAAVQVNNEVRPSDDPAPKPEDN
jgi:membrane fusion protein (multidrug efflux system)